MIVSDEKENKPKPFLLIPYLADQDVPIHARLTLAAIIYRNRIGQGATIAGLSKMLGFDRKAIRRHLNKLNQYVYSDDGRWFARNPTNTPLAQRYKWKKIQTGNEWWQNILTIKAKTLPLPLGKTLRRGIVPMVLYDLLAHLKPKQTITGLSKMLGVDRRTVSRAIPPLVNAKHITATPIKTQRGIVGYEFSIVA